MELYCTKIVGSPILESPFPLRKVAWPGRTFCDCAKCASKKIIETTKVCRQPNWMVEGKSWWSKSVKNPPLFSSSWSNGIQWHLAFVSFNLPVTPPTVCLLVLLRRWCSLWCSPGLFAVAGRLFAVLETSFLPQSTRTWIILSIFVVGGGAFESSKQNYYTFKIC